LAVIGWSAVHSFSAPGRLGDARDVVSSALDDQFAPRVEVRVPAGLLSVARLVLHFADVPPEARRAAAAVRSAEVGVYRLRGAAKRADYGTALARADAALRKQGWDCIVAVRERDQGVGIYVPAGQRIESDFAVCVVVIEDDQAVVVAATGNPEPLVLLALEQMHRAPGSGPRHFARAR